MFPSDSKNFTLYDDDSKKRTTPWQEWLVDHAIQTARPFFHKSAEDIKALKNIVRGNIDREMLERLIDPTHISNMGDVIDEVYQDIPKYPVLTNIVNALVGDFILRNPTVKATVVNQEAVSLKEEMQLKMLDAFIAEKLKEENLDKDTLTLEIQKLQNDLKNFQTINEMAANEMLNDLKANGGVTELSKQAFIENIFTGSECLLIRNSYEPEITRIPIGNVRVAGIANIDDNQDVDIQKADIVVLEEYMNLSSIIKHFGQTLGTDHELFKSNNLGNIITGLGSGYTTLSDGAQVKNNEDMATMELLEELYEEDYSGSPEKTNRRSSHNTVKVYHIYVKVPRKIGKLWYPTANGSMEYMYIDGNVKVDKQLGQTVDYFYVTELWEGHKIGTYYVDVKPYQIPGRHFDDPNYSRFPIACRLNHDSIIDSVSALAITYVLYLLKLNHLWVTNRGKVMPLGLDTLPDDPDWTVEKIIESVGKHAFLVYDNFKKSADGIVAGIMSNKMGVLDLSLNDELRQCIEMLQYIGSQIQEITGVSPQRLGQTRTTDGLGVVQQSITQSTKVTEYLYARHELVERDMYNIYLDHARMHYSDKGVIKKQYVLSESSSRYIEFIGSSFANDQYNTTIIGGTELQTLKQELIQYGQAAMQNQSMKLSTLIEIKSVNSPSVMVTKLKEAERELQQMQLQKAQQEQALAKQQQELSMQADELNFKRELEKMAKQHEYKMAELALTASLNGHIDIHKTHVQAQTALNIAEATNDTAREIAASKANTTN